MSVPDDLLRLDIGIPENDLCLGLGLLDYAVTQLLSPQKCSAEAVLICTVFFQLIGKHGELLFHIPLFIFQLLDIFSDPIHEIFHIIDLIAAKSLGLFKFFRCNVLRSHCPACLLLYIFLTGNVQSVLFGGSTDLTDPELAMPPHRNLIPGMDLE